jgi:tetratricopeptide (TPR) repeat protein
LANFVGWRGGGNRRVYRASSLVEFFEIPGGRGMAYQQDVSLEEMVAAPVAAIVEHWQEIGAGTACDTAAVERHAPLLALLDSWLSPTRVEPLRNALAAGNQNALSALCAIDKYIGDACDQLLERAKKHKLDGAWGELNYDADLASRLAEARADRVRSAFAFFLLANARRGLGDAAGTVRFYERAIAYAQGVPAEYPTLAAAHDNIGNVLTELGDFDGAFEHYKQSQVYEYDPEAIQIILANEAHCQLMLGEFKAAAQTLNSQLKRLQERLVTGTKLAMAMDMAAQALNGVGEWQRALDMLERAKAIFDAGDLRHRAINALMISSALKELGRESEAGAAFRQAHDFAIEDARGSVDAARYERGFAAALPNSVPPTHEAINLFLQALYAKEHDNPSGAFASLRQAAKLARAAGDVRLALRIAANAVALLSDLGQVDEAIRVASEVQAEAASSGLALPEIMALGNLESLAAAGADIRDPLGPLGPLTRIVILREVHAKAVAQHNLSLEEVKVETTDTGFTAIELAILADNHCAYQLAADYYRKAVDIARSLNARFELVNRIAGLIAALAKLGDTKGADAAVAEIEAILNAGKIPLRGVIVGRRAIGAHLAETDRPSAISELQKSIDAAEQMRGKLPPGLGRAGVDRQFRDVPYRLSELLILQKRDEDAFDVLQKAKGRRLIEALAAAAGSRDYAGTPLTAKEAYGLMERAGAGTVLIDLMVRKGVLTAFVLADSHTRTIHVQGDESALRDVENGDVQERESRAVRLCLENGMLRELAERVCEMVPRGTPLMIVADRFLHNLPLHAIPIQGTPWIERMPIGYSPTAAILRFENGGGQQYTSALVAGDSRQDLPGAAEECENIAAVLGTKALLGPACSRDAIEHSLRAGRPDIVHLAVHGRGDPRFGGRSSLLLADSDGSEQWVDFQSLTTFPWSARLVVFSGCSTGLLGLRHGYDLLSVANAALEAGAKSVIASLWPVDDLYAKEFMIAFYQAFRRAQQSGPVDLRLLLDQARHAAGNTGQKPPETQRRDGRRHFGWMPSGQPSQAHDPAVEGALHWAPFCLFGAPIIEA